MIPLYHFYLLKVTNGWFETSQSLAWNRRLSDQVSKQARASKAFEELEFNFHSRSPHELISTRSEAG